MDDMRATSLALALTGGLALPMGLMTITGDVVTGAVILVVGLAATMLALTVESRLRDIMES